MIISDEIIFSLMFKIYSLARKCFIWLQLR